MKVYIFKQSNSDLFYITETCHITKLIQMFQKYCPEVITKHSYYDIDSNFKNIEPNKDITFLKESQFFDYFNQIFTDCIYKNTKNWYKLNEIQLKKVINYLESIGPKQNSKNPNNPKNIYKCPKCSKILSSLNYLNNHIAKCEGLTCLKCNAIFSNKYNYQVHIQNCGTFTCPICNASFNSSHKFKKHTMKCKAITKDESKITNKEQILININDESTINKENSD